MQFLKQVHQFNSDMRRAPLQHKLQLSIEDTGHGITFNWDSLFHCLMIAGKWLPAGGMWAN